MVVITLVEEHMLLATLVEEDEGFMVVVTLVEELMLLATLVVGEEEQEEHMLLATLAEAQKEGMVEVEALGEGIADVRAVAAALLDGGSISGRRAPRPMPLGTLQVVRMTAEVDLECVEGGEVEREVE